LSSAPLEEKRRFFLLYVDLEVTHGLRKRAIALMERATKELPEEERFDMFVLYVRNVEQWHGTVRTRSIYEAAINQLPDARIKDMCLRFAEMERRLGEIDRARAIYQHGSQYCEPSREPAYWDAWRAFEVNHGNEDTFRDMLRVKRAVQAQYSSVNFGAANMSNALSKPMSDAEARAKQAIKSDATGAAARGFVKGATMSGSTARPSNPMARAEDDAGMPTRRAVPDGVFGPGGAGSLRKRLRKDDVEEDENSALGALERFKRMKSSKG
jgi:pre-mRNA-splicing factor SYF1